MISFKSYIATSIDGFIAKKDGSIDWLHPKQYNIENEDFGYSSFMKSIDCIVMGRITYEKVLSFDPYPYLEIPIIVISKNKNYQLNTKHDVRLFNQPLGELKDYLIKNNFKNIYVDGGKLIQSFLTMSMLNELTITQIPIILGTGIPLFGELNHAIELKHRKTESFSNGFVQSEYELLK
ncbi:dihydrofolate reductase family protein (plasmid) [Leptospira sp. WS39.C2]